MAELLKHALTADTAVELALLNNRGLQASFSELGIAESDLVRAGRLSNPSFSFSDIHGGELAPGMKANLWGYNGTSPGPTLEAVEGDRVRIFVTNRLPEATSIHWHGMLLPSGMDGVTGRYRTTRCR